MCNKKQFKYCPSEIDECMRNFIENLEDNYNILACCCGHNKYPMTIVVEGFNDERFDLVSGKNIPRKKKLYKKDSEGYYYIPEVSEPFKMPKFRSRR